MGEKILKLRLLGRPQVSWGEEPVDGFVSEKALALFSYLALKRGEQSRERLAGLFWGEMPEKRAKANLRMAIYNLQQLFPGYLQVTRLSVAFNWEMNYWLDVEHFENSLAAGQRSQSDPVEQLLNALSLYQGEFLEGIYLGGSPELDEWLLLERERLRQIALDGFQRFAGQLMSTGEYEQAIQALRQSLRLEPWQESAHQQLMLALARNGDYTAALAQYETCRSLLADELGVDPMPDTTRLYERIKAARDLPIRHNLPSEPTPFIGRELELCELGELLTSPSRRLVTVIGLGGSGKTRLALKAATGLTKAFLHGVFLAPLASLSSDEQLPMVIGSALGLSFGGKEDPKKQLLRYLTERELLLVLDNCEHLPEVSGLVSEMLDEAPDVKILATSRERLNLQEEWLYELGGLSYPEGETDQNWDAYSAMQLFVKSAQRAKTQFDPGPSERLAIVRICRLVEGLPLGIELAAASVGYYSCQEIAAEIEHNLDFLSASWPDIPARHRSLRAVFDHSWGLILPEAQRVLRQLAVFRGGFSLQAARQVAGASPGVLHILVDQSLLHWSLLPDGSKRYDLHELLRQYADERLTEAGEERAAHSRHLGFFMEMAETARPGLDGAEAQVWMERLECDRGNFQAALAWALEDDPLSGLRLATALEEFWGRRGYLAEGRRWLETLLARIGSGGTIGDRGMPEFDACDLLVDWKPIHARALCALGNITYLQGNLSEASEYYQASLELGRELGDRTVTSTALLGLGATAWTHSDYELAKTCFQESLSLNRERGDKHGSAQALRRLAHVIRVQGQFERAVGYYEQSLELYRATGDRRGLAQTLEGLGLVARVQGDLDQAQVKAEASLALRRSLKDSIGISFSLFNLGAVAYERGERQQARLYLEECLAIRRTLGDQVGAAAALNILGDVALDEGDVQQARRLFEESLAQRRALGDRYGMIDDLRGLGRVYLQLQHPTQALNTLLEGLSLSREVNVPRVIAAALRDLGRVYSQLGDLEQSLGLARESFSLAQQYHDPRGIVESLEVLAEVTSEQNLPKLAARLLGSAAGFRSSTGLKQTPREQAEVAHWADTLRSRLGAAEFELAWEEGCSTPAGAIVEAALDEHEG